MGTVGLQNQNRFIHWQIPAIPGTQKGRLFFIQDRQPPRPPVVDGQGGLTGGIPSIKAAKLLRL